MILPNQTVTHLDTRAAGAGRPDRCFYCPAAAGKEHAADCVCRVRTVVLRTTVEYVVAVPEAWTADDIESHRNESTSCVANIFDFLSAREPCLCGKTDTRFVREATAEDEGRWGYGVADLKAEEQREVRS